MSMIRWPLGLERGIVAPRAGSIGSPQDPDRRRVAMHGALIAQSRQSIRGFTKVCARARAALGVEY